MENTGTITPEIISVVLLTASLTAGLARITVYLREASQQSVDVSLPLLVGWQVLFTFICYRMADLLGVIG